MKLKKILAAVAALATAATAFSSVAFASEYGSPKLTYSFEYPADPDGDGSKYLGVIISYEGFENLSRATNAATSGAAITNISLGLNYDKTKLAYEFGDNAGAFSGTVGGADPTYMVGLALNRNTPYATSGDVFVAYFSVADGVDFSKESVEFSYVTDPADDACLAMTVSAGTAEGIVPTVYGESAISTETLGYDATFSYGTKAPATKTYAVTLGEGATTDYTGALTAVPENTEITVTATEKSGYTATLKKDGVEVTSPYKFTVTADTTFTVDYTAIVPANPHKYTLDDKGTCMKDTVKGIYYSLSVKNVADKLAIKVSDKVFEATGIPEVTGDTVSKLTYVILGVPEAIYNAVPALGGVTSGETVFEAE